MQICKTDVIISVAVINMCFVQLFYGVFNLGLIMNYRCAETCHTLDKGI
jgi:hypothetical protein